MRLTPPAPSTADRLLHERIIVLGRRVDDEIAHRLVAELLLLAAEDPVRDISLYVSSPDGSAAAGLAVYDTIRLIPNDVSTLAFGPTAGTGLFLLAAGTPGRRFALPHSRVLLPRGASGLGGGASDVETRADTLEPPENVTMRLTAAHSGQPLEKVQHDALRERWLTAEQARDYGLVDAVLTGVAAVTPSRSGASFGRGR